jgi:hypothetical protein
MWTGDLTEFSAGVRIRPWRVESLSSARNEVYKLNGIGGYLRKPWDLYTAWVRTMDYSGFEYTNDRIGALEREVGQLKEELRRTRTSAASSSSVPSRLGQ